MINRCVVMTCIIVFTIFTGNLAHADYKSHLSAASQLTALCYNEEAMYQAARRGALLAVKDRFENNPKTKDYSDIFINVIMEVLDTYFHDKDTQDKIKMMFTNIYVEKFSEREIKEFIKFYRTPIGKKALEKLPEVTRKGWEGGTEIGSQVGSSPKYQNMLEGKIKELQANGKLPKDFK